jgi:hypothetical protein
MRRLFTGLLLILATSVVGQATNDSIAFCSQNFKVPSGCTVKVDNVMCDEFQIGWTYMSNLNLPGGPSDKEKLRGIENSFLEMGNMLGNFKKKRITCFLLDKEVKGYKTSYKIDDVMHYQIYAGGIINGHAVSVILNLSSEPMTNDDIPEFPKQIIRLAK